MTKEEILTAIAALRDDIRSTPMMHPFDAQMREQWGSTLADLARQLAVDVESAPPEPAKCCWQCGQPALHPDDELCRDCGATFIRPAAPAPPPEEP